jgi:uncharacterized protein
VIRSAKLRISYTGMLCALIGADAERLVENRELAGSVFETFAVTELLRQASTSELSPELSFHPRDSSGLKLLRDKLGDRFRQGVLVHLGPTQIPLGDRLSAIPLAALWA